MQRWSLVIMTAAALLTLWICANPWSVTAGTIDGLIRFELNDGQTAAAAGTRVYLTQAAVEVPGDEVEHGLIAYSAADRINTAHQKFYVNLQKTIAVHRRLAGIALADHNNTFRFADLASGGYYIVVAFPSMLEGYKVAWQIPVTVTEGRSVAVTLERTNLALPTFSRRYGSTVVSAGR